MKPALLWSPLCLMALGCAHFQMACPVAGGPTWIEVKSPHFTMRTNLPADDAAHVLHDDEALLAQLDAAATFFLPDNAEQGRTSLVVFDKLWEYQKVMTPEQRFGRRAEIGRFVPADERGRPMVAMNGEQTADETLLFALTQRLVVQRLHAAPAWLRMGLSEYFSVLSFADGKLALGAPTPRLAYLNKAREMNRMAPIGPDLNDNPLPPVDYFAKDLRSDHPFGELGIVSAWVFVHYLANGAPDHADRFRRFLDALAQGTPAADALVEQYGPLPALDVAYHKHLGAMNASKSLQWFIPYAAANAQLPRVAIRKVDDAELHELKATLLPSSQAEELALAKKHAPQSPELHRWLAVLADASGHDQEAEAAIEQATDLAGQDGFYRYERLRLRFAHTLKKPSAEQRLETLGDEMRAVAHFVNEPAQLDLVARYYLLVHEDAFGAAFAARAVALDPQCASCLATQASYFFASGDFPTAVATQDAAIRRWPDATTVPAEMTANLVKYRCRANPGGASGCTQ